MMLDEALGSESHQETEERLNRMSDEDFVKLIESLIRRRRAKPRYLEEQVKEEAPYIT